MAAPVATRALLSRIHLIAIQGVGSKKKRSRDETSDAHPPAKAAHSATASPRPHYSITHISQLPRDSLNYMRQFLDAASLIVLRFVSPFRTRSAPHTHYHNSPLAVSMEVGRSGSVALLRWFRECLGLPWHRQLWVGAARHGRLELLRWLFEEENMPLMHCSSCGGLCPWECPCIATLAARHGHVELLRWAHSIGISLSHCELEAQGNGNLPVLKYVVAVADKVEPRRVRDLLHAARYAPLVVVQYLHDQGYPLAPRDDLSAVIDAAAIGGQFDTVKWYVSIDEVSLTLSLRQVAPDRLPMDRRAPLSGSVSRTHAPAGVCP